jgi:hypothetical protein
MKVIQMQAMQALSIQVQAENDYYFRFLALGAEITMQ